MALKDDNNFVEILPWTHRSAFALSSLLPALFSRKPEWKSRWKFAVCVVLHLFYGNDGWMVDGLVHEYASARTAGNRIGSSLLRKGPTLGEGTRNGSSYQNVAAPHIKTSQLRSCSMPTATTASAVQRGTHFAVFLAKQKDQ